MEKYDRQIRQSLTNWAGFIILLGGFTADVAGNFEFTWPYVAVVIACFFGLPGLESLARIAMGIRKSQGRDEPD